MLLYILNTAMVTNVPRMFIAAWNLLVKNAANREPVPGMATLLNTVSDSHPDAPLIFVSTGAWNVLLPQSRHVGSRDGRSAYGGRIADAGHALP